MRVTRPQHGNRISLAHGNQKSMFDTGLLAVILHRRGMGEWGIWGRKSDRKYWKAVANRGFFDLTWTVVWTLGYLPVLHFQCLRVAQLWLLGCVDSPCDKEPRQRITIHGWLATRVDSYSKNIRYAHRIINIYMPCIGSRKIPLCLSLPCDHAATACCSAPRPRSGPPIAWNWGSFVRQTSVP